MNDQTLRDKIRKIGMDSYAKGREDSLADFREAFAAAYGGVPAVPAALVVQLVNEAIQLERAK